VTTWIYTDADNTLWDTDALFAQAQLALLDAAERFTGVFGPDAERLQYVRKFDQAIAARHHQRLRYPTALLLRALCSGLLGISVDLAAQRALVEGAIPADAEDAALRTYEDAISTVPPILKGVAEGLRLAQEKSAPVYVITEGPAEKVRARLLAHGLQGSVAGVLSAHKTRDLYARLLRRAEPHRSVMIGDQPDRDCRPAHEAGMRTILVMSRFIPAWVNASDVDCADAVVNDFEQAISSAMQYDAESIL
jgi:putative hydrolase of the HAD superfamily